LDYVEGRRLSCTAHEILAAIKQVQIMRNAIAAAGRPGLHLTYYPQSTKDSVFISVLNPEYGIRKTDAIRLCVLPELKIQNDYLQAAAAARQHGCFVNSQGFSVLGGFAGGPETAVITTITNAIIGYVCYGADHQYAPNVTEVDPEKFTYAAEWTTSQAILAHTRNLPPPIDGVLMMAAEPGNVNNWREVAVRTMRDVVVGAYPFVPHVWFPRRYNAMTPLEIQFSYEVADAVVRNHLKIEEVTEFMKKIVPKLLPVCNIPARERYPHLKGLTYEEAYDKTDRPTPQHLEQYNDAVRELRGIGFPI
jgi:hypothetical protein